MISLLALALLVGHSCELHRPLPRNAIGPEPTRAHVNLGPIILPTKLGNREQLARFLQQEADRLGADGFYIVGGQRPEARDPAGTMLFGPQSGGALGDGLLVGAIAGVVELVQRSQRNSKTHDAVLHAYTWRELPIECRDGLKANSDDVLTGRISIAEFEMRRTELLAAKAD